MPGKLVMIVACGCAANAASAWVARSSALRQAASSSRSSARLPAHCCFDRLRLVQFVAA
jgi:hypothetical protein